MSAYMHEYLRSNLVSFADRLHTYHSIFHFHLFCILHMIVPFSLRISVWPINGELGVTKEARKTGVWKCALMEPNWKKIEMPFFVGYDVIINYYSYVLAIIYYTQPASRPPKGQTKGIGPEKSQIGKDEAHTPMTHIHAKAKAKVAEEEKRRENVHENETTTKCIIMCPCTYCSLLHEIILTILPFLSHFSLVRWSGQKGGIYLITSHGFVCIYAVHYKYNFYQISIIRLCSVNIELEVIVFMCLPST
ncbi:uncharacterized protein GGS22DRAFT_17486 [Annulohypoxylon maeteangense]|uniref:uncharacterized protein n=1 Tax=Annulohypoxylon maeteangense TaxID=1927788 RepID=UPI00200878B8|nr:uncharacterized protein GGS22DRAFT_17486 [Annulohypoxylon maeteangense]KAI0890716.1 hypothetical protein GGS22DRAFT_17486 [Annulohypoxylon maeteangense]